MKTDSQKGFSNSVSKLIKSSILVVLFAAAFAYFSNPVMFELRVQDLQEDTSSLINSLSENSENPSLCDKNKQLLINQINEHGEIMNPGTFTTTVSYEGEEFENWETESSMASYSCSEGEQEGQKEDALYCEPMVEGEGLKLERTVTDEEGVIKEKDEITIKEIVLEDSNITDLRC